MRGRSMRVVSLLVIGAGPYGVAVAARAIERGIDTLVVGHPMGFWTDHMPEGMFLRSGADWHLDASGVDTFEAFIEDRGLNAAQLDPVPIAVFREYAAWFQTQKHVSVHDRLVTRVEHSGDTFVASLDDGTQAQLTSLSLPQASPTSKSSPSGRLFSPKASVPTLVISFNFRGACRCSGLGHRRSPECLRMGRTFRRARRRTG